MKKKVKLFPLPVAPYKWSPSETVMFRRYKLILACHRHTAGRETCRMDARLLIIANPGFAAQIGQSTLDDFLRLPGDDVLFAAPLSQLRDQADDAA
jgi:hypothetical protein